jgi:hypothetical protein
MCKSVLAHKAEQNIMRPESVWVAVVLLYTSVLMCRRFAVRRGMR